MAAPTPTDRIIPNVGMLRNGARTMVTFSLHPDLEIMEFGVTPMGLQMDPPIDDSTMLNVELATQSPGYLLHCTAVKISAYYNTAALPKIRTMMGKPQTMTVTHPNGAKEAAYGWIQEAQPGENKWKEKPTIAITFEFSSRDPVTCEEEGPSFAPPVGTTPFC